MTQEGLDRAASPSRAAAHEEPRFIILRHTVEYPRASHRARRQGHHLRLGRAVAQAGEVDGDHEVRHGRRRDGAARRLGGGGARSARSRSRRTCPPPRTFPAAARRSPATSSATPTARPSRCSTPTRRAGWSSPTRSSLAARAQPDVDHRPRHAHRCRARSRSAALYACVLGNDQALVDELLAAGRALRGAALAAPAVREYRDDLKSGIADLKNVGGGDAGTIIGALFLGEFVDGVPWAHLDIAGAGVRRQRAAARAARRDRIRRPPAHRVPAVA